MRKYLTNHLGSLIVITLSFFIIFFSFNEVFKEPGNISFASSGDGIKSTFGTLYHIEHDTSYWRTLSMNYPYGESVFFTGNQVFATNSIKFLKDAGCDLSEHALGILNIWLILSFVFCALFLHLIFRNLNLPDWISVTGALIITFLSPQWARLGGHYNLAYAWAFPVTIYLLMRFYKKPSFKWSVIISLFMFILCGKQLYFLVLNGILISFLFLHIIIDQKQRFGGNKNIAFHFLIQLIIPFIIFSFFTSLYDQGLDRTAYPWGFIQSTTRLESVFLPLGKPYARFLSISGSWKTVAYVGLTGTAVFLIIIVLAIRRGIKNGWMDVFRVTDNVILNVLFWGSVVSLVISLGFPFTFGLENLLNYTGPFRQFRAVGRFIFPFYYLLGIMSVYLLWNWQHRNPKIWIKLVFASAILFYIYDASINLKDNTSRHINKIKSLNDRNNELEMNQWVNKYDWSQYQAIMPVPYFNIGSENYWVNGNSPNHAESYIASLKTGLPLNAVMLSRTSISECLNNINLIQEPLNDYPVLKDLPDSRPFLLLLYKGARINSNEQRLIENAGYIDESKYFKLYKLEISSFERIKDQYIAEMQKRADSIRALGIKAEPIVYKSAEIAEGSFFEFPINKPTDFFEVAMPDTGWFTMSFWMDNIDTDLWPRTRISVKYCQNNGKCPGISHNFSEKFVAQYGTRGLYEETFHTSNKNQRIRFYFRNKVATRGTLKIDKLLLRKMNEDILIQSEEGDWLNNRLILKRMPEN